MKKLIILALILPFIAFAQNVKGTFSPAEDFTYAFLYKAAPDGADYVSRGQLDLAGNFEIPLDSTVTPGIYKIVYAIPPEENNFDFIYDGKETIVFNFSYEKGLEFTESDENKLWNSYLKSMDVVNMTINNYYSKENSDKEGFNAIFKTLKDTQMGYEELANGKLVSTFIIANRPYIPEAYEDMSSYSVNLKTNYLKQIDFSNYLLQSSSFLVDRVTTYVFDIIKNPNNDLYKQHVDDVASEISDTDAIIKTSLLKIIWQRFVALENHDIANYITDTYLLALANKTENKVLAQTISSYKNTSIGTRAPDFEITINDAKSSLHQLNGAEHYLIVFWSSACGHCLTELPMVKELAAKNPTLKVVAFGLESDANDWTEEVKKYPDFTHVIGLGKWDNPIVKTYGVAATPMYFLLSSSKVIMAKPYAYEDLEAIIMEL
ncbi:TlpA family protein disulfide reductase [Winogradskyella sp. UBA3174]|uniref:TlpA family protein disulfide reductase n=1 Tax=Winogradskyella sp. UBA3174 TaxID=1947785 RepID=UPI0025E068FE|nr:TlpA disulfide reductase family protein [Winogradskyella sp. UBA3174]|tara:strand:+ start:4644 stop:5945 length:1302 start_codon:yes stop_codon:yes gene_type:complete